MAYKSCGGGTNADRKRWRPEEIVFLQKHYPAMLERELAAALGRSVYSIRCKLGRMGLKHTNATRPITKSEENRLLQYYNGSNLLELAEELRLSKKRVYSELARIYSEQSLREKHEMVKGLRRFGLTWETIGEKLGYSGYVVERIYQKKKSIHPKRPSTKSSKARYRPDITDTTCMQLCIGDFEGIPAKSLCSLYGVNPLCLPRMLEDLRRTGLYRRYIETMRAYNPIAYEIALGRRSEREAG